MDQPKDHSLFGRLDSQGIAFKAVLLALKSLRRGLETEQQREQEQERQQEVRQTCLLIESLLFDRDPYNGLL